MSEPEPWTLRIARIEIAECPDCGFTFDAAHTDEGGTNYSCPCCAEARLTAALRTVERERDEARKRAGLLEQDAHEISRRVMAAGAETDAEVSALREQVARLEQDKEAKARIFAWLLGEEGEFPSPPEDLHDLLSAGRLWLGQQPGSRVRRPRLYWWRNALSERLASATPTENGHER